MKLADGSRIESSTSSIYQILHVTKNALNVSSARSLEETNLLTGAKWPLNFYMPLSFSQN